MGEFGQHRRVVAVERDHVGGAGLIGFPGDPVGEIARADIGGHDELLSGFQAEAETDGEPREAVE